ncbi:hypothetical protein E6O75_ATG05486 [Venturia nashicola]|uniref:DUF7726 domain-containing protein n=1 Tax=Venturia nashicola TaxID=86259 RepID=A0A4Z1PFJ5_9PEZI|nr:hypothetical protein E6O75_ATG05486 [Venturia nashicola]
MVSYQFDHLMGQWQITSVAQDENRYFVPSLPGDPPAKLEIPADRAHDPNILSTLAKYRPPLAESSANTPRGHSPANGKKRSMSILLDEQDDGPSGPIRLTHDCDQVRRKIRSLIDSGLKVIEFANLIGVSTPAYYRFMGQNGPQKGAGSETYTSALQYFQKYEAMGMPIPTSKKARSERSVSTVSASSSPSVTSTTAIPCAADIATAHATITLDGEYSDSVSVYDTCDDIRRKINAYLQKSPEPQASFLRTLMSQYHTQTKTIQSVQLQRFRNMAGPDAGNTNPVYYAAYVFFEKERMRTDKAKSEGRKKMEAIYPSGMGTDRPVRKGIWTTGNSNVTKNKYGQWVVDGRVLKA